MKTRRTRRINEKSAWCWRISIHSSGVGGNDALTKSWRIRRSIKAKDFKVNNDNMMTNWNHNGWSFQDFPTTNTTNENENWFSREDQGRLWPLGEGHLLCGCRNVDELLRATQAHQWKLITGVGIFDGRIFLEFEIKTSKMSWAQDSAFNSRMVSNTALRTWNQHRVDQSANGYVIFCYKSFERGYDFVGFKYDFCAHYCSRIRFIIILPISIQQNLPIHFSLSMLTLNFRKFSDGILSLVRRSLPAGTKAIDEYMNSCLLKGHPTWRIQSHPLDIIKSNFICHLCSPLHEQNGVVSLKYVMPPLSSANGETSISETKKEVFEIQD